MGGIDFDHVAIFHQTQPFSRQTFSKYGTIIFRVSGMNKIEELKKMLPAIQNSVQDLSKESPKSLCGPCPKCGGDDRFVYRKDTKSFWCRQCNEKGGDVIDFHAWI